MPRSTADPVLVTGATGFVGMRLAEMLLERGMAVRVLVRDPARLNARLQEACEIVTGDLLRADTLPPAIREVSHVYHCAANVNTWDRASAYEAANVVGVEHLVSAIAAHNPGLKRLVHVSTVDVYGFPERPCDEDCPATGGEFGYGSSKARGEKLLRERADAAGIAWTVIRPANVVGPRGQFAERLGRELRRGLMVTIDHGRCNAGLIHVDNLARYLIWAGESPAAEGEIFNARDDYDASWADFIGALRRAIDGHGLLIDLPFWLAEGLGRGLALLWRVLRLPGEPLLHPLIVRILGRTCGHSAEKIRQHSGLGSRIGFNETVAGMAEWILTDPKG